MASKRKAAKAKASKAGSAAVSAKNNPYVQRLVEDEDLRDNVVVAYEAARDAFERLNNGKAPTKVLLDDKKLHKDLKRSAHALRVASSSLREGPKKRGGGGGLGKLLLLAIIGAVAALVISEDLRNKLLDALFGAEEEFDYTTTTAAPAPPAQPVT